MDSLSPELGRVSAVRGGLQRGARGGPGDGNPSSALRGSSYTVNERAGRNPRDSSLRWSRAESENIEYPGTGSSDLLCDRELDQVRRRSATPGGGACGHGMDAHCASVAVREGRGNDVPLEHREEGYERLVRVRVHPCDVEGRPEFGTLALRGPERRDEVEVPACRGSYLDRRVGRPRDRTAGQEKDEGEAFGTKPNRRRPASTWSGTGRGTRNVGRRAR